MTTKSSTSTSITVRLESRAELDALIEHYNADRKVGPPVTASDVVRFAITALVESELL